MLTELWYQLSVRTQDLLLLLACLAWPVLGLWAIQWRYRLAPVVIGLFRQQFQAVVAMVLLITIATAVNIVFAVQERAVKLGSARASDPFDLLVAAPGSQIDVLLATVYLQPTAVSLLSPEILASLQAHPDVAFAAPVGFGDQVGQYPLIGTTGALLSHLANQPERVWFDGVNQIVAGSKTPYKAGDKLNPSHGHDLIDAVEHSVQLLVTSRLPETGTRWDHALIAPIEALWQMHGLGGFELTHETGPGSTNSHQEAEIALPGVPAIVVSATNTGKLYQLRQQFNTDDSMAFFPAEVLSRLHRVVGSVAGVVKVLTLLTQLLVVLAVLLSVFILMRSMASRFATLHALGAPPLFRFCLIWSYAAVLSAIGVVLGLVLGAVCAALLADWLSEVARIPVNPAVTLSEAINAAIFLNVSLLLACLPAWLVSRWQQADLLMS